MTTVPKDWQRRIISSVRWTERQPIAPFEAGLRGVVRGVHPLLLVASADIEHDDVGTCRIAVGEWDPVSIVASTSAADDVEVFNGREKIWAGSRVLAIWPSFLWQSPTNKAIGGVWYADRAWSATRIRGLASADIVPGGTGTIDTVKPLDGHYSLSTASVYLPTTYVSIEAGLAVWAELVYNTTTQTSRWEVYSADCIEAGG